MKLMNYTLLIVAASAAGLTFSFAENDGQKPPRPGGGEFFKKMDTDGDGKVSKAEAGDRWERMGKLDKNGDMAIDESEIPKMGAGGGPNKEMMAQMIAKMDTNSDGKITEAEAGERWERMGKLDKDGDGAVSGEELKAGRPGGPGAGGPGGGPDKARGAEMFSKADKDGDGKLSESEVPAEAWARLSKADANKDGAVTKEELAANRPQGGGGADRPGSNPKAGSGQKPKRPPVEGAPAT